MKKVMLHLTLSLLLALTVPFNAYAKTKVHILTEEELSTLYSLREQANIDTCLNIAQEDAVLLMQLARSEAGDSGVDAQLIVMNVVMNRLKSKNFPDNIHDIIFAAKQFQVVTNGSFDNTDINVDSHLALARLEMGEDISDGAIYFESASVTDSWQSKNREFIFEKFGQRFYR